MNPYLLLTPGPLSTSSTVKETMLKDWCTWDTDYNDLVQHIRSKLLDLACVSAPEYTTALMQGSGTFCVESTVGSILPPTGKLLVLANGAYGQRIATIARYLNIQHMVHDFGETAAVSASITDAILQQHKDITHVALVHCETTTGMLNPIDEIIPIIKSHQKIVILDAMSSFGGIPIDVGALGIDALISSANKCIQGVPGFGFVIIKRAIMEGSAGWARSLSLDLYDQWQTMEKNNGKWRFTSPTHTVRAFFQAIIELEHEGGIEKRFARYSENQRLLRDGMLYHGFKTLLAPEQQSPIITTFISPEGKWFTFLGFYNALKKQGFVIYPGKVTDYDCFRIGNIGEVFRDDILRLIEAIDTALNELIEGSK